MAQQLKYEVKIERKKRSFPEAKYNWEVEVFIPTEEKNWQGVKETNDRRDYTLGNSGRAYTLNRAKKKALKQIMSVEKDVNKNITFGAVFFIEKTTAEEAIKGLK
jgi:hypothetical protein